MTDEELCAQLKAVCDGDPEVDHCKCDDVMVEALSKAGFPKAAAYYNEQRKHWWYA